MIWFFVGTTANSDLEVLVLELPLGKVQTEDEKLDRIIELLERLTESRNEPLADT